MIGKIRFYPDYRWARMMGAYQARRLRGPRRVFRLGPYLFRESAYDRFRLAQRIEQWEGDDLQPADGKGLVIVETDVFEEGDGVGASVTVETFAIGPTEALVIDWREARADPEYAADRLLHVERAYRATGYIEGDRFCTIIDRLGDLIRIHDGGSR